MTDRDVHNAPALDVVGWFTLCPESGPLPELVPFQQQITSLYNETGILLAIHPEAFQPTQGVNQKLPLSIYESVSETEPTRDEGSMQVDGEESSDLKFRPLPFTVETDEAEMIAIDYVAKGAGSAAAVTDTPAQPSTTSQQPETEDKKGKKRADAQPSTTSKPTSTTNGTAPSLDTLTNEEQDQIATIQTRLNSVRMLQSRLTLLTNFLSTLPPSYLSDQPTPLTPTSPSPAHLPHLRNIQALLTRLSLLSPTTTTTSLSSEPTPLESAQKSQSNDAALTQLLSIMNHDVQALGELDRRFATVENARSARKKGGGNQMGLGGLGDLGDEMMQPTGGDGRFGRGMGFGGFGGGGGAGRGTMQGA